MTTDPAWVAAYDALIPHLQSPHVTAETAQKITERVGYQLGQHGRWTLLRMADRGANRLRAVVASEVRFTTPQDLWPSSEVLDEAIRLAVAASLDERGVTR